MKRFIYLLKDPKSSLVVYVGETSNLSQRFLQHLYGIDTDSKEKKDWINGLKNENLLPIMEVVFYTDSKRKAIIKESEIIDSFLNQGVKLFNKRKLLNIYQYSLDGQLVNTFLDARDIRERLGICVHVGRGTDNGYLFTRGYFDKKLLDKVKNFNKAKMKKVCQIDINGNKIAEFEGVREAGRITGIDHRSIAAVAGGSKVRKTAGGYKWEYF